MNFDHMPELHWTYGYPFAIALMAGVSAGLFALVQEVRVAVTRSCRGRADGMAGGVVVRLRQPGRRHGLRGGPLGLRPAPRRARGVRRRGRPRHRRRGGGGAGAAPGLRAARRPHRPLLVADDRRLRPHRGVCAAARAGPAAGRRWSGLRRDDDPPRAPGQGGPVAVEVGAPGARASPSAGGAASACTRRSTRWARSPGRSWWPGSSRSRSLWCGHGGARRAGRDRDGAAADPAPPGAGPGRVRRGAERAAASSSRRAAAGGPRPSVPGCRATSSATPSPRR